MPFLESFLVSSITISVPLTLMATGEIYAERSGVINVGLEGMILVGAFFGMVVAYQTGQPWLGLAAGAVSGCLVALLFSLLTVTLGADQVVSGTAINLFAFGLTGVLYRSIFGVTGTALTVQGIPALPIRGLSDLPFLGPVLFRHNLLVYLSPLVALIGAFLLFRTTWGMKIIASGEQPGAADTAGIDVATVRHVCVLISGLLAGLSGGYLSLAYANTFIEGMSAGRGFIALAIVILGRWHPVGAFGGALFFGAANALQFQFQAAGMAIPYQFFLMLPYILTLIVLTGVVGKARAPAALGRPYRRA
jgi:ABC-type uncharacterized transport system permease subunit